MFNKYYPATVEKEDVFLQFCHLISDCFIILETNKQKKSIANFLPIKERVTKFFNKYFDLTIGELSNVDIESNEFIARIFQANEISQWLYTQLRILHSNITIEKKISIKDKAFLFEYPFLTDKGNQWYTTPRFPISMGWVSPEKDPLDCQIDSELPQIGYSLSDKRLLSSYLYILTAFDNDLDFEDRKLQNRFKLFSINGQNSYDFLLKPFFNYWDKNKNKNELLRRIIFFHHKNDFSDYQKIDLSHLDSLPLTQTKRRVFFEIQTAFDRWLKTIGIPKGWVLKYELKEEIEKSNSCMFREEGENLWEILSFSFILLSINTEASDLQLMNQLFELFWITTKEGLLTARGGNFISWWRRKNHKVNNSDRNVDLIELTQQLTTKTDIDPMKMLKESLINIPVNAFFLAMPPAFGTYRCELTYTAFEEKKTEVSVGKIWVFSSINFPEIIQSEKWEDELSNIIAKQKILNGVMTEPLLNSYFNEDIKRLNEQNEKLQQKNLKLQLDNIKRLEQRRSVGKATHVISTPLNGLLSIAKQLPSELTFKNEIIHRVELLKALEVFSNHIAKGKNKPFPRITTSLTFFFEYLTKVGCSQSEIFEKMEDTELTASRVKGDFGNLWSSISQSFFLPRKLNKNKNVTWSKKQLYVVLDGLLTNAFKYNRKDSKASIDISLESNVDKLFLVVENSSTKSDENLDLLAKDLSECSNIDWIGVSIIHDACASLGFERPKWKRIALKTSRGIIGLKAIIQIGILEDC